MQVAIVKYNAGNIRSVDYALRRLGIDPVITDDHEVIRSADRVIFPGVGEASNTMRHLQAASLDALITDLKQPVLGICLGLQLMCRHSEEGNTDCLDIFPIQVKRFQTTSPLVKVPHMGWNAVIHLKTPLLQGIEEGAYAYFVHSYYAEKSEFTIGTCSYIEHFSAVLHRDNFYATQFHPEKSADVGAQIIRNFLDLKE